MMLSSNLPIPPSDVDTELAELERQIALAQQQVMDEVAPVASHPALTADDIQRQIEELQRELEKSGIPTNGLDTTASTSSIDRNDSNVGPSKQNNIIPQQPPKQPTIQPSVSSSNTTAAGTTSTNRSSSNMEETIVKAKVVANHAWEKPQWAIPDVSAEDTPAILTESIPTNLKKPNMGGYERKVFERNDLFIVKGTFQKPATRKVDEQKQRLVWIVVNINGTKAGKVVMHLYGNDAAMNDIVEKFLELKGLELKYTADMAFYVNDLEPNFYLRTDDPRNYNTNTNIVYGHVQEGHDILQQMMDAVKATTTSSATLFTIKQSHIYPIKKTRM